MKIIFLLILMATMANNDTLLFDFNSAETSGRWYVVNDNVMGGISTSSMEQNNDGTVTFRGMVSLENNGGFASVRAPVTSQSKSRFKGVTLRVRGDGSIYGIRFRTNRNFDGYAYQAKFTTEQNVWKEIKIPFNKFLPTFRGYTLKDKPTLESSEIAQVGIMIADKQVGEFQIAVDWIKFYN